MEDKIAKDIKNLIENTKNQIKIIQNFYLNNEGIFKMISSVAEEQNKFLVFLNKVKENAENERSVLLDSGWWVCPSLMKLPSTSIENAINKYMGGDKSSINDLIINTYDSDNCSYLNIIITDWDRNTLFQHWTRHVQDAFEAHKNKKYTLSIPILLLVAEGIATEFDKKNNIYTNKDRSNGGIKIKKAVRDYYTKTNHLFLSDLDILEKIIEKKIYENTDKVASDKILNRNEIIHGLNENYDTEVASLQCFLLLDVLSELN